MAIRKMLIVGAMVMMGLGNAIIGGGMGPPGGTSAAIVPMRPRSVLMKEEEESQERSLRSFKKEIMEITTPREYVIDVVVVDDITPLKPSDDEKAA